MPDDHLCHEPSLLVAPPLAGVTGELSRRVVELERQLAILEEKYQRSIELNVVLLAERGSRSRTVHPPTFP